MKRILVLLPLVLIALVVGAILAFNMGVFHARIEAEAAKASGAKVQLGKIQLAYTWPPRLSIGPSHIAHPLADVRWLKLDVEVWRVSAPYGVHLKIEKPQVEVKKGAGSTSAQAPVAKEPGGSAGAAQKPMNLKLEISNGEIVSEYAKVSGLSLNFEQKQLLKSPAKVHLSATVQASVLPVPMPVKLSSDALTLSAEAIKAASLSMSVGGLSATLTGGSLLKEARHRWLMNLSAPDLAKLPEPPSAIPAKNWKGSVRAKIEVIKASAAASWNAEGELHAQGVSADVQFRQDKIAVTGPFRLNAESKFSYIGEKPNVQSLTADADLTAARVEYQGMLSKPAGMALLTRIRAAGDPQKLTIEDLEVKLWDLVTQIKGAVELKAPWPGQIQIQVAPVNLAGAERWLIPLRASPVKGTLSAAIRVNGPLADPMAADILADSVKLKGFSATVEYEKPGSLQIRGPVSADIEGKAELSKGSVKSAEGQGSADLSACALALGPLRKEARAKFQTRFQVANVGQSLKIHAFDLASFFGNVSLKGTVEQPLQPKIDLAVELKPLLLSELRIAVPEFRDKIPKGTMTASLKLSGRLDTAKAWHDWPLLVSGGVNANIPEYALAPAAPAVPPPKPGAPPAPEPEAVPSEPFLPKGELTSNMRLRVVAAIANLIKEPDRFQGVRFDGNIASGRLTGAVSVKNAFGGGVEVRDLSVPLLDRDPVIKGSAAWTNLNIREVLTFTKPDFKEFASGLSSGQTSFATPMPGGKDFMSAIKARGEMNLAPVTFSTVKVGEMINGMLAKVPMIKVQPAKVEPLKGQMKMAYEMGGGALTINNLQGQDVDGSEIQMKGKVNLASFQGDLVGTFAWVNPPVKGCLLEGNADAKGRMVIPMGIKGDLMSPGMNLLSDVAGKIGARALECEKKKLVEKAKDEGKKQLEKEVKKQLKNLFGN